MRSPPRSARAREVLHGSGPTNLGVHARPHPVGDRHTASRARCVRRGNAPLTFNGRPLSELLHGRAADAPFPLPALRQQADGQINFPPVQIPPVQRSSPTGSTSVGWKCRAGWTAIGAGAGALIGYVYLTNRRRSFSASSSLSSSLSSGIGGAFVVPVLAAAGAAAGWAAADKLC